jgi:purine nucleosidase
LAARQEGTSIVALGPLTDLAAALDLDLSCARRWSQVIVVGGNRRSHGRWPPLWPYEFNLTKDRAATAMALREIQSLIVVPLDRACRLRAERAELERLAGSTLGDDLQAGSRRWVRRNRWLRGRAGFPVWDLVAAATLCWPHLVRLEAGPLSSGLPLAAYGLAEREALWVTDFDAAGIFDALLRGLRGLRGLSGLAGR